MDNATPAPATRHSRHARRRDGTDHVFLSANEIHDDSGHAEKLEAELDVLSKKLAGLRGKGNGRNGPVPRAQAAAEAGKSRGPSTEDGLEILREELMDIARYLKDTE